MAMRAVVLLSGLALAFVAGAQAGTARGTLAGLVTRGPITPVCVAEQPCDAPAPNVRLLFSRNGAVVGRAITNQDGRYRLRLPPGPYNVRRAASPAVIDRKLDPSRARVYAGRVTRVDFSIDTGIR
jgi:hypothetical protein